MQNESELFYDVKHLSNVKTLSGLQLSYVYFYFTVQELRP